MTPVTYNTNPSTARWFAHRVFDALGAAFIFAWWVAFGYVFIIFCLTSYR